MSINKTKARRVRGQKQAVNSTPGSCAWASWCVSIRGRGEGTWRQDKRTFWHNSVTIHVLLRHSAPVNRTCTFTADKTEPTMPYRCLPITCIQTLKYTEHFSNVRHSEQLLRKTAFLWLCKGEHSNIRIKKKHPSEWDPPSFGVSCLFVERCWETLTHLGTECRPSQSHSPGRWA